MKMCVQNGDFIILFLGYGVKAGPVTGQMNGGKGFLL